MCRLIQNVMRRMRRGRRGRPGWRLHLSSTLYFVCIALLYTWHELSDCEYAYMLQTLAPYAHIPLHICSIISSSTYMQHNIMQQFLLCGFSCFVPCALATTMTEFNQGHMHTTANYMWSMQWQFRSGSNFRGGGQVKIGCLGHSPPERFWVLSFSCLAPCAKLAVCHTHPTLLLLPLWTWAVTEPRPTSSQ